MSVILGLNSHHAGSSAAVIVDGQPVVAPVQIPIAIDPWASKFDSSAGGGCMVASPPIVDAVLPIGFFGEIDEHFGSMN